MSPFPDDDAFFRSHFERVNHLADRSYEQVRPAYRLGHDAATDAQSSEFEEIEKDLENGWLNIRVGGGDWASVRQFARAAFDRTKQGRIPDAPSADGSPNRPPFADPLGDAIDPDVADHPERL
jgi:hypothetical protein